MGDNLHMSAEDHLLQQHEEYISEILESGQPLWLLNLYSLEPEEREGLRLGYMVFDPEIEDKIDLNEQWDGITI
jgi:hypothetical protein